jgi:hypothetical protein
MAGDAVMDSPAWVAPFDEASLRGLLEKYAEIRRLRSLGVVDAAAPGAAGRPTEALRALAARFPGALRELDLLSPEEVSERERRLHAALSAGRADVVVSVVVSYHGLLRSALCVRSLLRRVPESASDGELQAALHPRYRRGPAEPPLELFTGASLRSLRRPPGGRLNPWVFGAVGAGHGISGANAESIVFPRGHCER